MDRSREKCQKERRTKGGGYEGADDKLHKDSTGIVSERNHPEALIALIALHSSYGELGSVIISQTIYDLFPPMDFAPNSTLPLTSTEFIQHILVPEAALCLVMDDMHQQRVEAIRTLRESAQYGVAMFPDDHTGDGYTVSEEIVKARAATRRREIQDEEDREEDEDAEMWDAFPEEDLAHLDPGKFSRLNSRASSRANSRAPSVESTGRPRRECAVRAQPIIESDSDSDISIASTAASTKSRSRKSRAKPSSKTGGTSKLQVATKPPALNRASSRDPSVEIIRGSDVPTKPPRPRPRPKVKNANATLYDTDTNPRTSDVEAGVEVDGPLALEHDIRWGSHSDIEKQSSKATLSWHIVDPQKTPKAKSSVQRPVAKPTSSLSSSIALHETNINSASR